MGSRHINLYVTDADRAALDALPADVSRSELLRIGLAAYRSNSAGCRHGISHCNACGALIAEPEVDPAPRP
ncbi:MAG: hypothetical protein ACYCVN_12415 [Acidimicrobiales bacterium]